MCPKTSLFQTSLAFHDLTLRSPVFKKSFWRKCATSIIVESVFYCFELDSVAPSPPPRVLGRENKSWGSFFFFRVPLRVCLLFVYTACTYHHQTLVYKQCISNKFTWQIYTPSIRPPPALNYGFHRFRAWFRRFQSNNI